MANCGLDTPYDLSKYTVEFDKTNSKFLLKHTNSANDCEYELDDGHTIGIKVEKTDLSGGGIRKDFYLLDVTLNDPFDEILIGGFYNEAYSKLIFGEKYLPKGGDSFYSVIGTDDYRFGNNVAHWINIEEYVVVIERDSSDIKLTGEKLTNYSYHPNYIELKKGSHSHIE